MNVETAPAPAYASGGQTRYAGNVAPEQNDISATLKNCTSPSLCYQVKTGGDISAAKNALFECAIQTAKLTNGKGESRRRLNSTFTES